MSSQKSAALFQILTRRLSRTAVKRANAEVPSTNYPFVKGQQKKYQLDDHLPVYIKGGMGDRVLFGATCVLTAIGLVMSGDVLYKLSCPSTKEE